MKHCLLEEGEAPSALTESLFDDAFTFFEVIGGRQRKKAHEPL
jgi:hypothetical protein